MFLSDLSNFHHHSQSPQKFCKSTIFTPPVFQNFFLITDDYSSFSSSCLSFYDDCLASFLLFVNLLEKINTLEVTATCTRQTVYWYIILQIIGFYYNWHIAHCAVMPQSHVFYAPHCKTLKLPNTQYCNFLQLIPHENKIVQYFYFYVRLEDRIALSTNMAWVRSSASVHEIDCGLQVGQVGLLCANELDLCLLVTVCI